MLVERVEIPRQPKYSPREAAYVGALSVLTEMQEIEARYAISNPEELRAMALESVHLMAPVEAVEHQLAVLEGRTPGFNPVFAMFDRQENSHLAP